MKYIVDTSLNFSFGPQLPGGIRRLLLSTSTKQWANGRLETIPPKVLCHKDNILRTELRPQEVPTPVKTRQNHTSLCEKGSSNVRSAITTTATTAAPATTTPCYAMLSKQNWPFRLLLRLPRTRLVWLPTWSPHVPELPSST